MTNPKEFVLYSDESYYRDKYRSICAISTDINIASKFGEDLKKILEESNVKEFKWKKLRSAKYRFCAIKFMEKIIDLARKNLLRVDVLIWKPEKSENEPNRSIFQKMYYHLFKNVILKRWPKNSTWTVYPDKQSAIKWNEIKKYLNSISQKTIIKKSSNNIYLELVRDFNITDIIEIDPINFPICQVCDLFGGMASFSHLEYKKIFLKNGQSKLNGSILKHTHGDREKLIVLEKFDKLCKNNKLGVSLRTNEGLRTYDPKNPINFWIWEKSLPTIEQIKLKMWIK